MDSIITHGLERGSGWSGADILGHSSGRQSLKGECSRRARTGRPVFHSMQESDGLAHCPGGRNRRRKRRVPPSGGKHHTPGSRTVGITVFGLSRWVYRLNRGGLEVVLGESGFRRAGSAGPWVGKPLCPAALRWKSGAAAAPCCGETLDAEFDASALVRTIALCKVGVRSQEDRVALRLDAPSFPLSVVAILRPNGVSHSGSGPKQKRRRPASPFSYGNCSLC